MNSFRPLLNELAARDPNDAVRRLAIFALQNGTPDRGTLQLPRARARTTRPIMGVTRKVSASLVKKSRAR